MRLSTLAIALGFGSMFGLLAASGGAAAQTCTGRSVAVAHDDVAQRVHERPEYIADDLDDEPASLYARRPQRGRNGR